MPVTYPSGPIVLVHVIHPETGLTECGGQWEGDTYRGYTGTPRVKCPGCTKVLDDRRMRHKPVHCRLDARR